MGRLNVIFKLSPVKVLLLLPVGVALVRVVLTVLVFLEALAVLVWKIRARDLDGRLERHAHGGFGQTPLEGRCARHIQNVLVYPQGFCVLSVFKGSETYGLAVVIYGLQGVDVGVIES